MVLKKEVEELNHLLLSIYICKFAIDLLKNKEMIRTVFTPDSNFVSFPIPDKYVGTELEIMVFPHEEISEIKPKKNVSGNIDLSFGAWADMDKSAEEICEEIRKSRNFRKTDIVL
jgi:hypothetical protein